LLYPFEAGDVSKLGVSESG